jgi:hypothetical protein
MRQWRTVRPLQPRHGDEFVVDLQNGRRPQPPRLVGDRSERRLPPDGGVGAPAVCEKAREIVWLGGLSGFDRHSGGGPAWARPPPPGCVADGPALCLNRHRRPAVRNVEEGARSCDPEQSGDVERHEPHAYSPVRSAHIGTHIGFRKRGERPQRRRPRRPHPHHAKGNERHPGGTVEHVDFQSWREDGLDLLWRVTPVQECQGLPSLDHRRRTDRIGRLIWVERRHSWRQ